MEFDISRVYTAVNAEELKVGDKVIVSNTVEELRNIVISGSALQSTTLAAIDFDYREHRFMEKEIGDDTQSWALAYLVERTAEKKWRAYKDCNELIKNFKRRYGKSLGIGDISATSPMWHPIVWLKQKNGNRVCNATMFSNIYVFANESWNSLRDLFENYIYLDGTPCGVEE